MASPWLFLSNASSIPLRFISLYGFALALPEQCQLDSASLHLAVWLRHIQKERKAIPLVCEHPGGIAFFFLCIAQG
jgi:hypothetical protein